MAGSGMDSAGESVMVTIRYRKPDWHDWVRMTVPRHDADRVRAELRAQGYIVE